MITKAHSGHCADPIRVGLGILGSLFLGIHLSGAASLADFGHGTMARGGIPALGTQPLLVILAEFTDVPMAEDPDYYDDFTFNLTNDDTVNGYFWENSNHRFAWTRATPSGVVGPISIPANDRFADWRARLDAAGNTNRHDHEYLWFSNIIARTMIANVFDFSPFDTNGNNVVETGELGILIYSTERSSSGSFRWTRRVKAGTSTVSVDMGAAEASHMEGLNLTAHETTHILETRDIYGSTGLSADLSLLAGTTAGGAYHMDPWHKMVLGWIDPKIRNLKLGGIESIRSVNDLETDQTLILYDSDVGTDRFFMVEYRSRTNPPGTNARYDRDVAGTGMVLWSVEQSATHRPYTRTTAADVEYQTVYSVGAPDLMRGGNTVWMSGSTTPFLRWDDGSTLTSFIQVHPFNDGDITITVEWLRRDIFWADFFHGGAQNGTFAFPFSSMTVALPLVPRGGTLRIKPSNTPAGARLVKPMRVESHNGPATIGR